MACPNWEGESRELSFAWPLDDVKPQAPMLVARTDKVTE
jgi:hypothetical protein